MLALTQFLSVPKVQKKAQATMSYAGDRLASHQNQSSKWIPPLTPPTEKFAVLTALENFKVNNFSLAKSTTSAFSFSCLMRKTQKFSPSKHDKRKSQQQARATCRMKTILQQQQQSPELGCFDNMAKVFPNMRCMCGWPFPENRFWDSLGFLG